MTTTIKSCPVNTRRLSSAARLRELFDFSYITGQLFSKVNRGKYKVGDVISPSLNSNGYLMVMVDGIHYRQHRVIWKWVTGEDPMRKKIDHVNGDASNNAWHNLRLTDKEKGCCQNGMNRGVDSRNTTGYKGVSYMNRDGVYRAQLKVDKQTIIVGEYKSAEAAFINLCRVREILHGTFCNHGVEMTEELREKIYSNKRMEGYRSSERISRHE